MRSVRLFDCLHYDGHSRRSSPRDGPELALKNLASDDHRTQITRRLAV